LRFAYQLEKLTEGWRRKHLARALAFYTASASNSLMKLLCSLLLIGSALVVAAHADVTITQNADGAEGMSQMVIKIKGDKARMEINPQITTIIDGKTGEMFTLMNDKKQVLHISAEKGKQIAAMASKFAKTSNGKPKLVPTGKKEVISGYEAEEYKVEGGLFPASYWITTKYPDYAAILKQLSKIRPATLDATKMGMPDYADLPGLPIRTTIKVAGQKEMTSTIISIEQNPIPDDQFTVPKDFAVMQMPDFAKPQEPSASPAATQP